MIFQEKEEPRRIRVCPARLRNFVFNTVSTCNHQKGDFTKWYSRSSSSKNGGLSFRRQIVLLYCPVEQKKPSNCKNVKIDFIIDLHRQICFCEIPVATSASVTILGPFVYCLVNVCLHTKTRHSMMCTMVYTNFAESNLAESNLAEAIWPKAM